MIGGMTTSPEEIASKAVVTAASASEFVRFALRTSSVSVGSISLEGLLSFGSKINNFINFEFPKTNLKQS